MKIRRRAHPFPNPTASAGNHQSRMRRDSPDLYNGHGEIMDREAAQRAVVAATAHNREHGKAPHIVGHVWG